MKYVITLLAALALAACGAGPFLSPGAGLQSSSSSGGIQAFATLAPLGSFDYLAAPAYTQLALVRHRAASLYVEQRLSLTDIEAVQASADRIRATLGQAREADAAKQTLVADALLATAYADLAVVSAIFEGK